MKKLFILTVSFTVVSVSLFAQSLVDTLSNILNIQLPTNLDTSTALTTFAFVSTLVSTALTIGLGYFQDKLKWLIPFASTTSQRVTLIGVVSSLIVIIIAFTAKGLTWGINEAIALVFSVIVGVFKGQTAYDKVLKSTEIKTEA